VQHRPGDAFHKKVERIFLDLDAEKGDIAN
jgi:hypothetical protein